ncbi:PorT family protein [Fulvivirga sp. RKSG066]|uniref:porin family protein n=1 Tax=Fulvivirga aurantia TaxID=2529383 RepID=UPI0012BC85D1|nr:porin family protein [Fulvivirga aurantia]MTI22595.1 PorT family protein [Fulvivirga aurantia]
MKKILPVLFISFISLSSWAQTVCTQTLRQARTVYDEGRVHELPSLLESCIRNGFTKEEKTEAYRLLILSYIYLDEPTKADETMLALLRENPRFRINNEADPSELINLYQTFRTWPVFRYGIKLGANYTYVNAISANGTNSLNSADSRGEYEPRLGFRGGVVFEVPLGNGLSLNPEAFYSITTFRYDNEEFIPGISDIVATEQQSLIELPINLQYQIADKYYLPYVSVGVTPAYLLASELEVERNIVNEQSVEVDTRDISEMRTQFSLNATASAGVKFPIGQGYYVLEGRFNYGLTNFSDQKEALEVDPLLTWNWRYADSEFKTNTVSIHLIGYLFDKYIPKKLKVK